MPEQISELIGDWEKVTHSDRSGLYPDTIQFQERGLYLGQNNLPGTFTLWDVGTYERVGDKKIKISTANDAIITYECSISKDILTFIDPEGFEFQYRRLV